MTTGEAEASAEDRRFMDAALALGRRCLGRTATNPSVGALVVKNGRIVGRGVTGEGGRPHGERIALEDAGLAARGATLYVTLEPCSHHGATPPCCEAVVAAGIARVVYAIADANPLVGGRGLAYCRDRGLDVVGGVGAAAAQRDHRGHLLRVSEGRPAVTLKLAETANGFAAGGSYDPRLAITGVAANGLVHVLRGMHDAIMVGIGTITADDPLMTVRFPGALAKPKRIVLDPDLATPPRSRLLQTAALAPTMILAAPEAIAARGAKFAGVAGLDLAPVPLAAPGQFDLRTALRRIGEAGVTRVFSEGGPSVAASLVLGGLADDVLIFTSPRPFGGDGVPALNEASRAALRTAYTLVEKRQVGEDLLRRWERAG